MFASNDENSTTSFSINKERALLDTTNEQLKSHLNKSFEQARPIEGMQSTYNHGNYQQPNGFERQKSSIYYAPMEITKIMSESEKLDDQMRNGTDYVNLPAHVYPLDQAPTWFPQQETSNNHQIKPREIRYLRPSTAGSQISRNHYANHQQMDAENRLQQLEVIRPTENINLLNVKFHSLQHPRHARPILPQYRDDYVNTFYDQTGTYVQERSGLYHTESYDPSSLVQAISELENQEGNDTTLNNLGDLLDKTEQNRSKPKLFQYRAIGDYQNMRSRLLNRLRVSNDASTTDSRTQEGNKQFVHRESTYGQAYNTPKFLQVNTLSKHARTDPGLLMSTRYNNNLDRVRNLNSYPIKATQSHQLINNNQEKSNDTLVSPTLHPAHNDELYSTKYITEHTDGYSHRSTVRVYDSPFKSEHDTSVNKFYQQQSNSFDPLLSIPAQLPRSVKTSIRLPGPEVVTRSIEPKLEPRTTYQRSFKDVSYHESIPHIKDSVKDNNQRFGRTTDNCLKQWKLRDLQDGWSKTQAQRQYQIEHPEVLPDVGGNTIRAKKEILIADAIAKRGMLTVR